MPYRQDIDTLKDRCDTLETELASLRARAKELHEVARDEARVARELDEARKMLGDKRALPLLDNLRVASPCNMSWDAMTGDERVRFCGSCEKNVYNLSAMSREDGERLLVEKEGKVCVRFYRRADGTVMTTDCPVGARKVRRRIAFAAVGGGLLAAAAATLTTSRATMGDVGPMQGAVAIMPPTQVAPPTMGEPFVSENPPEAKPVEVTGHTMGRIAPPPARSPKAPKAK